jgi:hypothetical protein
VRNAPAVDDDLDRLFQPGGRDGAPFDQVSGVGHLVSP